MNEIVKRDIAAVMLKAAKLAAKKDTFGLNELSNHTIHNSSIFQDEDSVIVAVVVYALSKEIQRGKVNGEAMEKMTISAADALSRGDIGKFRRKMKQMVERLSRADFKMRMYVTNVIEQAQIKKGTKLCEHGISVARSAKILGISQWELMNYIGKTNVLENSSERVNIHERLGLARRLFS